MKAEHKYEYDMNLELCLVQRGHVSLQFVASLGHEVTQSAAERRVGQVRSQVQPQRLKLTAVFFTNLRQRQSTNIY